MKECYRSATLNCHCFFFQEGEWRWTDGSKFEWNVWHKGEPNNAGTGEHCMEINFRGKNPLSLVLLMKTVHNIQDGIAICYLFFIYYTKLRKLTMSNRTVASEAFV